ncbi:MAG: hypothetical protein IJ681_00585 [Bacteroidales bacterium]|nr:hypothetical protein [Bacteroidales bacterium]
MKINYLSLFLKAIVFALIVLALKTFFNGVARADEFTEILNTGYTPVSTDYRPTHLYPKNYDYYRNDFDNSTPQPVPVYDMPTGLTRVELSHPVENPFTTPTPTFKLKN